MRHALRLGIRSHSHAGASLHRATMLAAAAAAALVLTVASAGGASAYTLKTLHSFCANCTDGNDPLAGLVMDQAGNLYGTTQVGGSGSHCPNDEGCGIAFELVPNANKTKYKEHILHNFCTRPNCTDGGGLQAGLILDTSGNLYGTTAGGGTHDGGVVFKLTHGSSSWGLAVLHNFCASTNCTDGNEPAAGLTYAGQASGAPYDGTSPLYGTTDFGGHYNHGTAYELSHGGSGWTHSVLHNFNTSQQPNQPLMDSAGNLLGTTERGGAHGGGLLYRLASGTWQETVLHQFCSDANCADGGNPSGQLAIDAAGNIFGTASTGGSGAHCTVTGGCGVAFERGHGGKYAAIYDFCTLHACKDGGAPSAGPILDASGTLFGTTYIDGANGAGGTVFSLSHDSTGWHEQALYSFCALTACADGAGSVAPVLLGKQGTLYGTTAVGGANDTGGTVFRLTP